MLRYLAVGHGVMWFVRIMEPSQANQAAVFGILLCACMAVLVVVQYSMCSGTAIECLPMAWRSGTALVTVLACLAVDMASRLSPPDIAQLEIDNLKDQLEQYIPKIQELKEQLEHERKQNEELRASTQQQPSAPPLDTPSVETNAYATQSELRMRKKQ